MTAVMYVVAVGGDCGVLVGDVSGRSNDNGDGSNDNGGGDGGSGGDGGGGDGCGYMQYIEIDEQIRAIKRCHHAVQ